jgi:hypothetical protein
MGQRPVLGPAQLGTLGARGKKKKRGPDRRGPPVRITHPNRYRGLLPQPDETQREGAWEEAVVGELTGAGGDRRRGALAAEEGRLGHRGAEEGRGRLRFAGNGR